MGYNRNQRKRYRRRLSAIVEKKGLGGSTHLQRSDLRLLRKAIREGWPMSDEMRERIEEIISEECDHLADHGDKRAVAVGVLVSEIESIEE